MLTLLVEERRPYRHTQRLYASAFVDRDQPAIAIDLLELLGERIEGGGAPVPGVHDLTMAAGYNLSRGDIDSWFGGRLGGGPSHACMKSSHKSAPSGSPLAGASCGIFIVSSDKGTALDTMY